MFTRRSKEYFSAPPKSKHHFEQNLNAFLSNGKPNFYVVPGKVFQRWRAMCPEKEAARQGTQDMRDWWDSLINSMRNGNEDCKKDQ